MKSIPSRHMVDVKERQTRENPSKYEIGKPDANRLRSNVWEVQSKKTSTVGP